MDLERDYLAGNRLKLKIARCLTFLMILGCVIYTFATAGIGNIEPEYQNRNIRSYHDPYNYLDDTTKKVIETTNNELNRQYGSQIFVHFVEEKDLGGYSVEDYAVEQFNHNNLTEYDILMVVVPNFFPEADFYFEPGNKINRNFERSNFMSDSFYDTFVNFLDSGEYTTLVHFTLENATQFYHEFAPNTSTSYVMGFPFTFLHVFNVFVFIVVFIIVVSVISGASGGRRHVRHVYYNPVKRRFWHMPRNNFHRNNFYHGGHNHHNNHNNFSSHNKNSGGGFGRSSNWSSNSNHSKSSGGFGRSSGSSSNRSSSSSHSKSSGGFGRSSGGSKGSGSSGRSGGGFGRRK